MPSRYECHRQPALARSSGLVLKLSRRSKHSASDIQAVPQLVGLEQCRARLCQRPGHRQSACEAKGETPAFPVTTQCGLRGGGGRSSHDGFCLVATGVATGMENLAYGELGSHPDRPHHPGRVSREHGQRRSADHRWGRHLHRPRQQLRRRQADGRGPAGAGHGGDPQPGHRHGRDRRLRQQRQLRRQRHRQLRGRRRQHADRHLQRGGDGGGDRGADREPDLRQFLRCAGREPQLRAQGHRRRRLRRHHRAARGADRRRQSVQRRRCGVSAARRASPTSTATATSTPSSGNTTASCTISRTPARPPRRPSPRAPAPPIRSTASMWGPTARPASPTSTATATSTPSSGQTTAPCAISRTPARPPRRPSPRAPAPPIRSTASLWGYLQHPELRRSRRRRRPRRRRRGKRRHPGLFREHRLGH